MPDRSFNDIVDTLRDSGLRPTRQRVALARLLFTGDDRHVTAEGLHSEAERAGVRVSLATIYNTLHQFTEMGLLSEVVVEAGRSYFDTNTAGHHHFFDVDTGRLVDIPDEHITISGLPAAPDGSVVERVDVVVRVRQREG